MMSRPFFSYASLGGFRVRPQRKRTRRESIPLSPLTMDAGSARGHEMIVQEW